MPIDFSLLQKENILPDLKAEFSFTDQLSKLVTTPITTTFDLLDYPGAVVRGILAGRGSKSFSFTDRASGKDVLKNLGVKVDEGFLGGVAGFATEVVLDPLIFTSSITGLSKAGKWAKELDHINESLKIAEKVKGAGIATEAVDRSIPGMIERQRELYKQLNRIDPSTTLKQKSGLKHLDKSIETQIAEGKRGLSFLGQTSAWTPPKPLLKVQTFLTEKGLDNPITRFLKEKFSTAKNTEAGQLLYEYKEAAARAASLEAEKIANQIKNTLPTEDSKKALIYAVEDRGITPQTLDASNFDYSVAITNKATANIERLKIWAKDRLATITDEGKKIAIQDLLAKSIEKQIKKANKLVDNFNELIQYRKAELGRRQGFVQQQSGKFPDITTFATKLGDALDDFLKIEQANYIDITKLEDPLQSYLPHITTAEGREFLNSNREARNWMISTINTKLGFTKSRQKTGFTIEDINKHMRTEHGLNFDVLSQDPSAIFASRAMGHANAVSSARNVNAAIELYSTSKQILVNPKTNRKIHPFKSLDKSKEVHIAQLLETSGITAIDIGGKHITWDSGANARQIWSAIKKQVPEVDLEKFNRVLDADLVVDIKSMRDLSESPDFIKRWMAPINNIYKVALTAIPPASIPHVGTNVAGFLWMNHVAGVNPLRYTSAVQKLLAKFAIDNPEHWVSKAVPDAWKKLDLEVLKDFKLSGASQTHIDAELFDLVPESKSSDSLVQKLAGKLTGRNKISNPTLAAVQDTLIHKSMDINRFVEEVARLTHFEDKLAKGFTTFDAAGSVKKYLFDYTDLTDWEKKYAKHLVLFYTFARKNLPLAMQEMFQNRRAYTTAKFANSTYTDDDTIPEYVRNSLQWRLAPGMFLDVKNPIGEANRFSIQNESVGSTPRKIIGQLNPVLKIPFELMTGIETFRGKSIEELNRLSDKWGPMWHKVGLATRIETKSGIEYRMRPYFYHILKNLPTSRIAQVFSDIVDPETSMLSISGLRLKKFDVDKLKKGMERESLLKIIKETPQIRQFTRSFSIEKEPSDRVKILLKRLRQLEEQ